MIRYLGTSNTSSINPLEVNWRPEDRKVEGYQRVFSPLQPQGDIKSESSVIVDTYNDIITPPVEVPYRLKESKRYNDANEFIADLLPAYEKALNKVGLDKSFAPYLVAQDALETGWGRSYKGNYNFGNITVGNSGASYTEGRDKDAEGNEIVQKFRNFESLEDYAENKIALLNGRKYRAFDQGIHNFYSRIKAGGYAQDKQYVNKLNRVLSSVLNRIS